MALNSGGAAEVQIVRGEPTNPTIWDWGIGTTGFALGMFLARGEFGEQFAGIPFQMILVGVVAGAFAILLARQITYSRSLFLPEWSIVYFISLIIVFQIPTADTLNHELHQTSLKELITSEEHFDFWRWGFAKVACLVGGIACYVAISIRASASQWLATALGLLGLVMFGFVARVFVNHYWFSFPAYFATAPQWFQACMSEIQGSIRQTPTFLPATFFAAASFYRVGKLGVGENMLPRLWTFRMGQLGFFVLGLLLCLVIVVSIMNLGATEIVPAVLIRSCWFVLMLWGSVLAVRKITKFQLGANT